MSVFNFYSPRAVAVKFFHMQLNMYCILDTTDSQVIYCNLVFMSVHYQLCNIRVPVMAFSLLEARSSFKHVRFVQYFRFLCSFVHLPKLIPRRGSGLKQKPN